MNEISQNILDKIDIIRQAFDSSPIPNAIIQILSDEDKAYDFKFVYANEALAELECVKLNEIIGRTYFQLFRNAKIENVKSYAQVAYYGGKNYGIEYVPEIDKHIGIWCYQLCYGIAVCIINDVTTNIERENDYRKQLYLYRTLTDSGVFTVRIDEEYTLLYGNDRYYDIHEYTREKMTEELNNKCKRYIYPDDLQIVESIVCKEIKAKKKYVKWTMRIVTGNGNIKYIQTSGEIIVTPEGDKIINGVVLDVTENVELEKQNIALERASIEKTRFLSNMSHDIRTPMNAIINLSRIARDDYSGVSRGNVLDDLDKIEATGNFLLGLINDILDMSRIESGKMTLHPEVYMYDEFLNYVQCIFEPLCERKNIKFVWEKGTTAIPLYIDKVRFNQLFFNIISNSIKYTPNSGKIECKVYGNVIKDGFLNCSFSITDNGCGMSEEFQKKMYEPFERETRQENNIEGTGLGLSIVKNIIELMNGSIDIESKVGVGTRVTIALALQIATDEQIEVYDRENTFSEEVSLEGKTVLVVEDNLMNMIIMRNLMEKKGMNILEAENGKQAIKILSENTDMEPDIILMDVRMPVMDGLEATRKIREMENVHMKTIPIIALTANAFEEDRKMSRDAGMTDYLTKPVNPELLYKTIQKYFVRTD